MTSLAKVIQDVNELAPEEQRALLNYLTEKVGPLEATPRPVIRLRGVWQGLGLIPGDQDPIAEALDELRREREAHFEKEWPA